MATVAEEQAKAPEPGEELVLTPEDALPPEGGQEGGEEGGEPPAEPSIEELASKMGWRPKEQFRGDPEKWRPAADFIMQGHEIQRNLSRDLSQLKTTVDTIRVTTSDVMRQKLEDQRRELAQEYAAAVEAGDTNASFRIARQITDVDSKMTAPVATPTVSPAVADFTERNSDWFNKDPLATERAVRITNELAAKGYSEAYQLAEAERLVKIEHPHLFQSQQQQQRTAPSTHTSARTAPAPSGKKGFAHLPAEAQKMALHMEAEHGVSKELYATNYFANLGKGQKNG